MEQGLHGFISALAEAIQNKLPKKSAAATDKERFIIFPPSQMALSLIKQKVKNKNLSKNTLAKIRPYINMYRSQISSSFDVTQQIQLSFI